MADKRTISTLSNRLHWDTQDPIERLAKPNQRWIANKFNRKVRFAAHLFSTVPFQINCKPIGSALFHQGNFCHDFKREHAKNRLGDPSVSNLINRQNKEMEKIEKSSQSW